jgi:hypothetical protein
VRTPDIASSIPAIDRRWCQAVRLTTLLSLLLLAGTLVYVIVERDVIGSFLAWSVLTVLVAAVPYAMVLLRLWIVVEKRGLALGGTWAAFIFLFTSALMIIALSTLRQTKWMGTEDLLALLLCLIVCLTQGLLAVSAIKAYYSMSREKGDARALFKGVLEAVGFILVIILVPGFTFPTMGYNPRGNEARAVRSIREIQTCAARFAARHPERGYPASLAEMGPAGDACLDEQLAGGRKNSYVFVYAPGRAAPTGRVVGYTIHAHPIHFEQGVLKYFSNETAVIHWTAEGREASDVDPPLKPNQLRPSR